MASSSLGRSPALSRSFTSEATGEANGRTKMYYIYVLESQKDRNLYVGCTSNIENRLKLHNKGAVQSTKHRTPFKLVYYETYEDKYEAFRMERFYKSATGKKVLKNKIMASSSNG